MLDYTICYRRQLTLAELGDVSQEWGLFISAYNDSERVLKPFEIVRSTLKHWVVHREYQFKANELPDEHVYVPAGNNEADFWHDYLEEAQVELGRQELCIDATGFMRPHLAFLLVLLKRVGVGRVHFLYTDPERYVKAENTQFTKGPVTEVRQVSGFEGIHSIDTSNDLLIIGAGYDHQLIRRVAEFKENARKLQLFGLPSLQPSMYQESVISASRAAESLGAAAHDDLLFAPASDPFVTAQVLHERVNREHERRPLTNLYLSALGTKPQVLGFALYFATERLQSATSLVFPFAERYTRETSKGISRIWHYTLELDGTR